MRGFLEELHWILSSDRCDLVNHHLALIRLRGLKINFSDELNFSMRDDKNQSFQLGRVIPVSLGRYRRWPFRKFSRDAERALSTHCREKTGLIFDFSLLISARL